MALSKIRFFYPKTLLEAFEFLRYVKEAHIMAGGTDLLVDIKEGLIEPSNIISLQEIKELKGIEIKNKKIRIGALVTIQELIDSPVINKNIPVLADAAASMASPQIRSTATVGGNISSAVPSADLPPSLIAADASAVLRSAKSSREVFLSEFFLGPREAICRRDELLAFVIIPLLPPETGISYKKFSLREANALAVASVASRITLKKGLIKKAAVVLGAVAPTPVMALETIELLRGNKPSVDLIEKAALLAEKECHPISDIRGSAWFRKELVPVLTRRSLTEALGQALGKLSGKR